MNLCYNIRELLCTTFLHLNNNNQVQRELFNTMLGSSLYVNMSQSQPFEDGHDTDVAHGEN